MKKFIALVLSLVMALSLCVPAWGAEGDVSTLEELKAANGNVTITQSITVNEDVELTNVSITANTGDDLIVDSGATLTLGAGVTINSNTEAIWVKAGGTLIIDGATVIASSDSYPAVLAYGEVYIEDGSTVYGTGNAEVVAASTGGKVIVNGGEVYSEKKSAMIIQNNGDSITINGGTVSAKTSPYVAVYALCGTITVDGTAVVNGSVTATAADAAVVVKNGTINGNVAAYGAATASAKIEGGEVTGTVYANDDATLSITGGTFAVDPTPYVAEGYKAFEIVEADGGGYFVAVPYDVTFDANGGNGELTQAPVPAGQFTLPTEHPFTREGYTFKGWATDKNATEVLGATYDVTGNVTFYAIWEEVPAEDDKPVVVPPVADETVDAEVKVEDVKSSEITLNEGFTQADIDNATEAEINTEFAITVASPTDIPADVQAELSDADDVICLDIDLHLYIDGDHAGNITKLDNVVEVRIPASVLDDFAPVANGYTRTYYVVHHHDTVVEVLPAELDGDDLVIYSDKFSPYYVAYEDTPVYYGWGGGYVGGTTTTTEDKPIESPETFDAGIALYVGMSVAAAVGTVTLSKKRED